MNPIRSILAATDFSDDAGHAVLRAAFLAGECRADLHLLHVISEPSLSALRQVFPTSPDTEAKLLDDARRTMDEMTAGVRARTGIAVDSSVKIGHVPEEILAAAAQSDMLVVGARGWNPLRDLILGTTSERLLAKCRQPVLIVKRAPLAAYQRVLVPVDLSQHSAAALRMAILVGPQAEITVVHAFGLPFEGKLWLAGVADEDIRKYQARTQREALDAISVLVKEVGGDPHRIYRRVEHGAASAFIVAREEELKADLIVIGKHGKSKAEEWLFGSVTRHVLSDSRCDVLVVQQGRSAAPA
jgi:nucleotide-binding universal stress UspA family protein